MRILPARAGPAAPLAQPTAAPGPETLPCCPLLLPSLKERGLRGLHAVLGRPPPAAAQARSGSRALRTRPLAAVSPRRPPGRVTCAPGMPPSPNHVQPNPDRGATFPAALLQRACSPCLSLTRHAFCIPSFNASILVISLSPPRHCATVEVLSLGYNQDAASLPLNHTHIHFQGDKGDSALPWLLKGGTGAKGAENDCP